MAITKTIEIDVNSSQANKNVNQLTTSLEQNEESVKSLKQQYKEAVLEVQRLADEFGATSQQAAEAAKKAADLKDKIEDANDTIAAFKGEGAFNATAKALGSVASGFSAVEGAITLAGGQSEEFEKVMLRLNGAMALAQGLQGLEDVGRSFSQLKTVAVNALGAIKKAIGATGIGLLVVALGAIYTYWDDIKELVGGVSDKQKQLNKLVDDNLKAEQAKLDSIGGQDNILKLQGKSEKEILQMKIKQTDAVIQATEAQIKQNDITAKAQIAAAKRNKDILKGILDFLSIPFQTVLKTIDMIGSAVGKDFGLAAGFNKLLDKGASLIFDPVAEAQKAEQTRQESLKAIEKLKNDRAGLQLSIQNIDKQAADKAKELRDKQAEEEKKALEEKLAREKQYREDYNKIYQDQQDKELQDAKELREEQLKVLEDAIEAEATAEENRTKKLKEENDKRIADEKTVAEAKLAIQNAGLDNAINGIGVLKGLFEKNKALQKGLLVAESAAGIAKIVINTRAANAAAKLKYALIPGGQALSTAEILMNNIGAGIGIAANVAATAKALSALGGGGASSGGGVGGSEPAPQPTPQFNVVGNTGVNQLAATIGQQQPVQAYVVANQVTSQQALDRNIVNNASLG